ncbi:GumC family protein [Aurantiacibacter odishensis]|uniref:GumC family protein n=1 Tax=Aurantiacibacter odishensis TaxID=1155476 RepID=UPI0013C49B81|nr:polysaccharide biosynthesis tyrosine autokinase [Aurantiacibacter odishensis]
MTAIRAVLWRQRFVIVAVVLAALLAGFVMTMLATPVYQSSTTVRVEVYGDRVIAGQELVDPYIPVNEIDFHIATLARVVRSQAMAEAVVEQLDLHRSARVMGDDAPLAPPEGVNAAAWEAQQIKVAANRIKGSVSAAPSNNVRLITITYESPDPEFAQQMANAYGEAFLTYDLRAATEQTEYARDFLRDEIAKTREELEEAETRAISYARANRLIGQPGSGDGDYVAGSGTAPTLSSANLQQLNSELTAARTARIAAEQRWRSVANLPARLIPEVQQNGSVQALEQQSVELENRIASLRERYQDDYPDLRDALQQLERVNEALEQTRQDIKSTIQNAYEVARRQEAALAGEVSDTANETLDEQDRRVQYNLITREVVALRLQLQNLIERSTQISAAANLRSSDLSILDRADRPGAPVSPDLMENLLIALALGLGLAAAIAVLRETLDDKIRSFEDIQRKLGIDGLGHTPYVSDPVSEEIHDTFSPLSESYASIRASLDAALPTEGTPVIQLTSSQGGEGKSTTAAALAEKYARLGRKVLLVDLDLRRPTVHVQQGLPRPDNGVVDVLYERVPLERAVARNEATGVHILGVSKIPENPVEILSSGLVRESIARWRQEFDVILIDCSPVLGIADAPLVSRYCDATVFVVEANRTSGRQARQAIRRMREMGGNVVASILTKYQAMSAGESYNYQYQYYSYGDK